MAHPVLEALGISQGATTSWPRIQWILTGPLTSFPIHAAGYHDRDSCSVIDRTISSYSASLRSLVASLHGQDTGSSPKSANNVVAVGAAGNLVYASQGIDTVTKLWNGKGQVYQPILASDAVLEALKSCDIFHFAGHGHSHSLDPLRSALVLKKNDNLTVSSLLDIDIRYRKPFLAYLSACGTGRIKNKSLTGEGVHLMAAFQLTGFRHVIGTLWDVDDQVCVEAATLIHNYVRTHDRSDDSVSEALHFAVKKLRAEWKMNTALMRTSLQDENENKEADGHSTRRAARDISSEDDSLPLHWAPYVHFGI